MPQLDQLFHVGSQVLIQQSVHVLDLVSQCEKVEYTNAGSGKLEMSRNDHKSSKSLFDLDA